VCLCVRGGWAGGCLSHLLMLTEVSTDDWDDGLICSPFAMPWTRHLSIFDPYHSTSGRCRSGCA
jgi:hypothetical protein